MRTVNGRAGLVILSAPGAELAARIVKGQEDPPQGWVPACQTPPRCSVSGPGEALRDCLLSPQQALRSTSE